MVAAEAAGTQVRRPLPDACQASSVVAAEKSFRRGEGRGGDNACRLRSRGMGETAQGRGGGGGKEERE